MSDNKNHVCPVGHAGFLDNKFRKFLQNPAKILSKYIESNMIVLDFGCGPGFFTIEIAKLLDDSGRVIASDLQPEMLDIVRAKAKKSALEEKIVFHRCEKDRIDLSVKVDLILAFYMLHELPDIKQFFIEAKSILKPSGKIFIAEPVQHVSKKTFADTILSAEDTGFLLIETPKILFSRTAVMKNL